MLVQYVLRFMAGIAAGLLAAATGSAQPYVGLGLAQLSVSSEYSAIDGRSGSGFALIGGHEFAPTWFAEFSVSAANIDTGPTENIFYPADGAEYSVLRFGIRKSLWPLVARRWAPWFAAGGAYHYANWDTFFYQVDGLGFYLGAGVDFELAQAWRARLQGMWDRVSAHDTYGYGPFDTRTTELAAALIYVFR